MEPATDERRSELERRLGDEPSGLAFRRICALIDTWPAGESRDQALALADRGLAGWPDATRAVARPWWLTLGAGPPKATWGLVREIAPNGDPGEEGDDSLAETLADLLDHPALASIRRLDLSFGVEDKTLVALGRSGHLGRLRSLDLSANWPGREAVEELARSGLLGRLRELSLAGFDAEDVEILLLTGDLSGLTHLRVDIDPARLVEILGRGRLGSLSSLHLSGAVTPEGIEALGRWPGAAALASFGVSAYEGAADSIADALVGAPGFARLGQLDFGPPITLGDGSGLTAEGVSRLTSAPFFAGLSRLALPSHGFGDAGAEVLAGALPPSLEALDLRGAGIGPEGARALGGRSGLDRLASLNLDANAIGDEGLAAIAGSRLLEPCRRLDVGDNGVGAPGVAALAGSAAAGGIADLRLARNPIGDAGALALSRAGFAPGLVRLDIGSCEIGNRGASALFGASSGLSGRLEDLRLGGNVGIGSAGIKALAASPHLDGLLSLDLSFTGCGKAGVKHLAESAPLARLVALDLQGCEIATASVRALVAAPLARGLEVLAVDALDNPNQLKMLAKSDILRPEVRAGYVAALEADSAAGSNAIRIKDRAHFDHLEALLKSDFVLPEDRVEIQAALDAWLGLKPPPSAANPNRYLAAHTALFGVPGNGEERDRLKRVITGSSRDESRKLFVAIRKLHDEAGPCRGPEPDADDVAWLAESLLAIRGIEHVIRPAYDRYLESRGKHR